MTALENLPPTIGVEEAGELLGLCRTSAYEAVKRGEIQRSASTDASTSPWPDSGRSWA